MKEILFLMIHYNKQAVHYLKSLKTNQIMLIEDTHFDVFLSNMLNSLQKHQKKLIIFVYDLGAFKDYITTKIEPADIQSFSYKNIIYSLIYSNVLYPQQKIIFKDCLHFLNDDTIDKLQIIAYLQLLAKNLKQLFAIDIYGIKYLSIISVSNAIFKKISLMKQKKIIRLNETEDRYIRGAYHSGRAEIIRPLSDAAYYYDVNSLYPFIMKNYPMPIGIPKYVKQVDLTNFYGIVNVYVRAPSNNELPILPVRSLNNHSELGTIYPIGSFKGLYFSEELKLAVKYGYKILAIYDGYLFEKEILFDEFVDKLYNLRVQEQDIHIKKIYKLMMNCVYGRYGAIYEKIKTIDEDMEAVERKFENVAVSVAITAYARIYMYEFVKKHDLILIYWDTDGIIIRDKLPPDVLGSKLGHFRLIAEIEQLLCISSKFYAYKSNQEYFFVLRGINQADFTFDKRSLFLLLYEQLITCSYHPYQKTIEFTLQHVNGTDEFFTFIFHNKRELLYQGLDNIYTKPWRISDFKAPINEKKHSST